MCGICGKYSPAGVSAGDLQPMLAAIVHRGPDDQGVFVNGRIGLGSRRLSIIDLPGGRQPIANEDGTIWVAYNGEIYNYRQLRRDLEAKGHVFRTASDTEVIVHLYEDLGEKCVGKLNGMFAFAIWDKQQQKLVLARDRIGQKPLFYSHENGDFLFASEIKSILAAGNRQRDIDYEAMHHYLSLRFIPPPATMLRHVRKLPAAHLLVYQEGKITISRYWDLSFRIKTALPEKGFIEALDAKLTQVVNAHMVGDVQVGAFLSGGMDSSMIVAMMAGESGPALKTFAIGVAEQDFNELPYARLVADRYRTEHFEESVTSNLITSLPKIIWHLDEPSDPIAACQFHAAALAARHVKVVLGGDGGDELFGGFDRYLGIDYAGRYARIPSLLRRQVIGPLLDRLPENFTYKSLTQQLRWVHRLSLLSGVPARFAEATLFFRFDHLEKQRLFGPDLWQQVGHLDSADVITTQFARADGEDDIDRMLYADFMTRLAEHSLMLADRMTMAHGLELRSPFLDHELMELLAAFPSNLKIRGRVLKYALRKLAADYLPEAIIKRGKQGFMFPVAYWFRNELYGFIKNFLLNSFFVREGVFDKQQVLNLIEEHRHNRRDHHVRLWMLLNLEVWHQLYIENRDVASVTANLKCYL
jgi:asparagine synthase (glutamine-hydrolysing)